MQTQIPVKKHYQEELLKNQFNNQQTDIFRKYDPNQKQFKYPIQNQYSI